ncbi:MAG: AAA family ATPase [Xanthomonadales bacterium]|nr:AAA family ATPase [Xanthomonadales bacterium]
MLLRPIPWGSGIIGKSRKLSTFFREIWRRRVLQVAIPYGVGAWLLVQVAEIILDAFEAPPWIMQGLLVILVLGFPLAVVLAWVFDITPEHNVVRTRPLDESTEPAEEAEEELPAPAVSLEMGDSERRQVTMLNAVFEVSHSEDPEIDPEFMRDAMGAIEDLSRSLAERFGAHPMPGASEELSLVFGYPQAREDDARRAVTAALALIKEAGGSPALSSGEDRPGFALRAGISTGLVVVDESGKNEGGVAIIGQAPRMATWLKGLSEPGTVTVGPHTRKLVANYFELVELGRYDQPQFGGETAAFRVGAALSAGSAFQPGQALTGRKEEMHLLGERWENVLDGGGEFVVLQGEPGIGKSSLMSAFVQRVVEGGGVTLVPCQCSPYEQHNPLAPVIRVLRESVLKFSAEDDSAEQLLKLKAFLQEQSVDAGEALPLLTNLLSLRTAGQVEPPSGSAQIIRMQTLELLLEMIAHAASVKPMLLVLEDMHWADPSTLEMLQMMVDRGPSPGLFMLFTTRPGVEQDWVRRSYVLVQELLPLPRRSVRELIESTAGEDRLPDSLTERIISETDGNPLFVQELTLAVLESRAWRESRSSEDAEDAEWLEIPASLQDSLTARIDNLGENKSLLQLCSVLGREFSYDLLRSVSGTENEPALKEALAEIVKAELLFQRGLLKNLTYTFKHILIQETAYNSLLKSKRRELHARAAEILEQDASDVRERQPGLLAYHWGEAGDPEKAIPYWTLASRQSLSRFANVEAIEQARRGIQLLDRQPESPGRAAGEVPLQSILGTALLSRHGYADERVRKVFTRALELCEQIGDAPQLFQVAVGLWMYYTIAGKLDEAHALSQRLLRIAETTDDPAQHLQARYCQALVLYYRADYLTAKSHLETALESESADCDYAAQSASGDDTRLHVRVLMALINWHLGFPKTAATQATEARAIARRAGHPWGDVFAAFYSAWLHQMRGDAANTQKYAEEAARVATEKGFRFWLPLVGFMQAWAGNRQADGSGAARDETGVEQMKEALDQYRGIGSGAGVTYLSFKLAEDYVSLGLHEKAKRELQNGWDVLQTAGENFFEPEYHRLLGRICLAEYRDSEDSDRLAEADGHFSKALSTAQKNESKALELRAALDRSEVLSLEGKGSQASAALQGILVRFDETDNSADFLRASALIKKLK